MDSKVRKFGVKSAYTMLRHMPKSNNTFYATLKLENEAKLELIALPPMEGWHSYGKWIVYLERKRKRKRKHLFV